MPFGNLQFTPSTARSARGVLAAFAIATVACGAPSELESERSDAFEGGGARDSPSGWGGTGSYGGWGGYIGDINDPASPPSPTGSYSVVERDPRSHDIVGYSVGWDRNNDGEIDQDEFGPVDFGTAMAPGNPVGVVDVDLCCFFGNIPSPLETLGEVRIDWDQRTLERYLFAWYTSPLRDELTDFAFRRVSFRVTTEDSPSMFVLGTRTLYISRKDLRTHGIVALDHELIHAGFRLGRAEQIMDRATYRKLNRLNVRRFSDFDGYVGTILGRFDGGGFGAAKAFVIGYQYAKLKRARDQLAPWLVPFADQYIQDVEDNLRIATLADGRRLRIISRGATPEDIARFLGEFTRRNSETSQEIREALAGYPAPIQLPYISPLPPPPEPR